MSESSRGTGLRPQLRERIAAQHQEIEQQTVRALKKLSVSCQASVQHELRTITSVMAQQSALVRRSFARLLFWIVSLSLALILSLSLEPVRDFGSSRMVVKPLSFDRGPRCQTPLPKLDTLSVIRRSGQNN